MRADRTQPLTFGSRRDLLGRLALACLGLASAGMAGGCDSTSALNVLGRQERGPRQECPSSAEEQATRLPLKVLELCRSATVPVRTFGAGAAPLEGFCRRWLGASCERFSPFRLLRIEVANYESRTESRLLEVQLFGFETPALAYGYFTRSVLMGGDPRAALYESFSAGAAAVVQGEDALVFHGNQVIFLRYLDPKSDPASRLVQARSFLPEAARRIVAALGGEPQLPLETRLLPTEGRVRHGTLYETENVLDLPGLGSGAVGYYERGSKRWRLVALERPDEEAAEDVTGTLKKFHGASVLKQAPLDALALATRRTDESPRIEWLVARRVRRIYALGDDDFAAMQPHLPHAAHTSRLTESEKMLELGRFVRQAEAVVK